MMNQALDERRLGRRERLSINFGLSELRQCPEAF